MNEREALEKIAKTLDTIIRVDKLKYADDALYGRIQALIKKKRYAEAQEDINKFMEKYPTSSLLRSVQALKSKIPY